MRKNFIPRNEGFKCEACNKTIPPARGTFRNHCPVCLTSKHVDGAIPGDRANTCHGLMPTVGYTGTDPSRLDLIQECDTCQQQSKNRTAPDDDISQLFDADFNEKNV